MMKNDSEGSIEHEGIVQEVNDDSVLVSIISESACAGCRAKGVCNMAGSEKKVINVNGKYDVVPGNKVTVVMKQSMGLKAIVLSYLLPFLVIVGTLIILVAFSVKELIAGLISIGILVPYFLVLYSFRNRINKNFTFTLKI